MAKLWEREIDDIIGRGQMGAKELVIRCPKVTYKVNIFGKTEEHTYHDITDAFNDFEEAKVMGRRLIFEK